jgi:hypothetical protein
MMNPRLRRISKAACFFLSAETALLQRADFDKTKRAGNWPRAAARVHIAESAGPCAPEKGSQTTASWARRISCQKQVVQHRLTGKVSPFSLLVAEKRPSVSRAIG